MPTQKRRDNEASARGYSARLCLLAVAATLVFADASALVTRATAALYWPDGYGVARANTDGSEFDKPFIPPGPPRSPVTYAGCPGIAVDASHVYWSQPDRGAIGRANLNGSGVEYDFLTGLESPCGVAVDGTSIYWAEVEGGMIGKADLDGSDANRSFISGVTKPCGVAVGGGYLYWSAEHDLARVALSGGVPQLIHREVNSYFCGVAVDETHVYWGGFEESIGRAKLDGSNPEPSFITGIERPCGIALEGSRIYWTVNDAAGSIQGADLEAGLPVETIIDQEAGLPCGLAADSTVLTPPPPLPSILRHAISFRGLRHGPHSPVTFIRIRFRQTGRFAIRTGPAVRWRILSSAPDPMTVSEPGERLLRVWPATGRPAKQLRARLRRAGKAQVLVHIDFNAQNGAAWTQGKWLPLTDRRHA